MSLVLCLHTTYTNVESALARDKQILGLRSLTKEQASAQLIPTIDALLTINQLNLSDISHIIVNQGPAPFTTLRTIIATVNGIAFAHKVPLVGVDALEAFMSEYADKHAGPTAVLLNAFNKAVYYYILNPTNTLRLKGYAPITTCIELIKESCKEAQILCIGNGAQLYHEDIKTALGAQVHFPDHLPLTASIEQIIKTGLAQIENNQGITQSIEPLYLKKPLT
jgi:tRNA threonylcarbamoyladenosine biosynthesis protein TsaB